MGQKPLCKQGGQTGEESFKLGTVEGRDYDPQSSEEVVTWVGKQRMLGNVDKTELVISETRQKETNLKCMHKYGNAKRTA